MKKKPTISKELAEICEHAYRLGFEDGHYFAVRIHGVIDNSEIALEATKTLRDGLKKTRKQWNIV